MARPVGSQNKLGMQAKNALWNAYNRLGGEDGLVRFGKAQPEAFYKMWVRLIPNDARIELAVSHTVTRNFTGKATEMLPEIAGEATLVGVATILPADLETSHSVSCEVLDDTEE